MNPSPIEAARARHPLAEVAALTGVDHFRTTGSVTVRCPLPAHGHPDRTPSLRLHLDDGIFSGRYRRPGQSLWLRPPGAKVLVSRSDTLRGCLAGSLLSQPVLRRPLQIALQVRYHRSRPPARSGRTTF